MICYIFIFIIYMAFYVYYSMPMASCKPWEHPRILLATISMQHMVHLRPKSDGSVTFRDRAPQQQLYEVFDQEVGKGKCHVKTFNRLWFKKPCFIFSFQLRQGLRVKMSLGLTWSYQVSCNDQCKRSVKKGIHPIHHQDPPLEPSNHHARVPTSL